MPLSANGKPADLGSRITFGDTAIQLTGGDRRGGLFDFRQRSQAAVHHHDPAIPRTSRTATPMPSCNQTSERTVCWISERSMATVISSPCGPRTDTARHCTSESSTDPTVVGLGPDVVVGRQRRVRRRRSLMAIRPRPSRSHAAHIEIRRRAVRVRHRRGTLGSAAWGPAPSHEMRRAASGRRGWIRCWRRIEVTAMPDAARPQATSSRVAATSPTRSGTPRSHPDYSLCVRPNDARYRGSRST